MNQVTLEAPPNKILDDLFKLYSDLILYDTLIEAKLCEPNTLQMLQEDTFAECERLTFEYLKECGCPIENDGAIINIFDKEGHGGFEDDIANQLCYIYRRARKHVHQSLKSVLK